MYTQDLDDYLSTRHDNGGDFWATPDLKIGVGGPFSTLNALLILSEFDLADDHDNTINAATRTDLNDALQGAAKIVLDCIQKDGRVRVAPKGAIYPCHTALAAAALCRNGYARDERVISSLYYLISNPYEDGGWRCNKFIWGRGPETDHSNPGVTLWALDAFRCSGWNNKEKTLDRAVETLLDHWTVRVPTGPCHFGIGEQYMKVEYPFLRYNLFYTTCVLSFYKAAKHDPRFLEMLDALRGKLDDNGQLVVERPHTKLAKLKFCKIGEPSEMATGRYGEILANLKR